MRPLAVPHELVEIGGGEILSDLLVVEHTVDSLEQRNRDIAADLKALPVICQRVDPRLRPPRRVRLDIRHIVEIHEIPVQDVHYEHRLIPGDKIILSVPGNHRVVYRVREIRVTSPRAVLFYEIQLAVVLVLDRAVPLINGVRDRVADALFVDDELVIPLCPDEGVYRPPAEVALFERRDCGLV